MLLVRYGKVIAKYDGAKPMIFYHFVDDGKGLSKIIKNLGVKQ